MTEITNDWIDWDGGNIDPLFDFGELKVDLIFRAGDSAWSVDASDVMWAHNDQDYDVVKYKFSEHPDIPWINWDGSKTYPVPSGSYTQLRTANNLIMETSEPEKLDWFQWDADTCIEAYRVIPKKGKIITREVLIEKTPETISPESLKEILSEVSPSLDMVNSPTHYQLLPGVEVYDVRVAMLKNIPEDTPFDQVDDWSRATEYLMRMWNKNGLEDAKKSRWYLDKLIEKMEGK